ncbi:hypothetical protein AMATHDRAFT_135051, partial [Amanita thiersii Skay4041]
GLGQYDTLWRSQRLDLRFPNVEWVFPQAPERPVTYNEGQFRPSWFDIHHLPPLSDEDDHKTLLQSVESINAIIQSRISAGMPSQRIFLFGFSQGAALSLTVALTTPHTLGGLAVLSGWVPHCIRPVCSQHSLTTMDIPILWCHGDTDDEIPKEYGEEAIEFLTDTLELERGLMEYRVYKGLDHKIIEEEIGDLEEWLRKLLV